MGELGGISQGPYPFGWNEQEADGKDSKMDVEKVEEITR
jgi:hypothetical protein